MAKKQFKCNVCGYVHEGAAAPDTCPVCGAPASEFTELKGIVCIHSVAVKEIITCRS